MSRSTSIKRLLLSSALCLSMIVGCDSLKSKGSEKQIESKEWNTFKGSNRKDAPNVVLISGDEEYRSEEGLTQMAKILSKRHGFNCTVHYSQDPKNPGVINSNYHGNIPGLEQLKKADLMIILTRFRALADEQMEYINEYLEQGKPVVGLRTSTHAFQFKNKNGVPSKWAHYSNSYNGDKKEWIGGFGRLVLGEKWISHHGHHKHQSTTGVLNAGAENNPITNGIENGDIWAPTDVYGVRLPLPGDSQPIILGQVTNRAGTYNKDDAFYGMRPTDTEVAVKNPGQKKIADINSPMMPVAWTKSYQLPNGKKGKAFASTMGASTDLASEGVRRLVVNASYWALGLKVPKKANVKLVGEYTPSAYGFKNPAYWVKKNLKVTDLK